MHHRTRVTASVATAALLLAGCSSGEEADTSSSSNGAATAAQEDTEDAEAPTAANDEDAAPDATSTPSTAGAPDQPLATVEGDADFGSLEVLDLRRDGDAVTVEFAITATDTTTVNNLFAAEQDRFAPSDEDAGAEQVRRSVSGVTLIDRANDNRHLVLRDSTGRCLCTSFPEHNVTEGERYRLSAQFPAPPEDVAEMTVEVPQFPSVDGVAVRSLS